MAYTYGNFMEMSSLSTLIRNATEVGENTAKRVGGVLVDIAEYLGDVEERLNDTGIIIEILSDEEIDYALGIEDSMALEGDALALAWRAPLEGDEDEDVARALEEPLDGMDEDVTRLIN